jgi:hypothetical protein
MVGAHGRYWAARSGTIQFCTQSALPRSECDAIGVLERHTLGLEGGQGLDRAAGGHDWNTVLI